MLIIEESVSEIEPVFYRSHGPTELAGRTGCPGCDAERTGPCCGNGATGPTGETGRTGMSGPVGTVTRDMRRRVYPVPENKLMWSLVNKDIKMARKSGYTRGTPE